MVTVSWLYIEKTTIKAIVMIVKTAFIIKIMVRVPRAGLGVGLPLVTGLCRLRRIAWFKALRAQQGRYQNRLAASVAGFIRRLIRHLTVRAEPYRF